MKQFIVFFVMAIFFTTSVTFAQFHFLEKKVQEKIEKAIEGKSEEEKKDEEQKDEESTDNQKKELKDKETNQEKSLQTYSKYDFVPGEKVIFFDDFTQDAVGDFPALWNTNGSAEVTTNSLYPGNWLKFNCNESIWTDALLNLPDNYTIEYDVVPIEKENDQMGGFHFRLIQSINAKSFDWGAIPGKAGFAHQVEYFGRSSYRTYIAGEEGEGLGLTGYAEDKKFYMKKNELYHIAIWVQKARLRLYLNESKMFDLPKAFPVNSVKMDRIRFEEGAAMVTNVRIAVGAPDMRNKLLTEGKLVSYGIYFDSGKDILKPESYGTLKGIADVLKENPNVRVKIVGHTDSDGADAANLDLSKRRSESVKNELVKTFSIDAARLEADGMGESQPLGPNDTPANKALNRRVEFLKL